MFIFIPVALLCPRVYNAVDGLCALLPAQSIGDLKICSVSQRTKKRARMEKAKHII